MHSLLRTLLATCLLASAGCSAHLTPDARGKDAATAAQSAAHAPGPMAVILISIDGYRADYLQRGFSPNLEGLAREGVRAQWMIPSFPTLTFPNHYTLVTGLYPDHHGIVGNNMEDPAIPGVHFNMANTRAIEDPRWWNEATPIWVSVQRQGGHAATMFWPGSSTPIHGMRPDHWVPYDRSMPAQARVDHVLHWLDLAGSKRPRFITLYFGQVDRQAHRHGPDSAQVNAAIRATDAAIGQLVQGLKSRHLFGKVDLVIVSDHGMAPVPLDHRIYLDDLVDVGVLHPIALDALAAFRPAGHGPRTQREIASLLSPHPHMHCLRKSELPARLHYGSNPRVPPLLCLAQTGWVITTHRAEKAVGFKVLGEHGYDNADPLMHALFIAEGPSFRHGYVAPPFPNVDVYPLLAHLLRIVPEKIDGDYETVRPMLAGQTR